ncbi:MAG: hypothetical protein IT558_00740 [Alphaproteobacteria bacterium]|nr:hypothetical protein [Alphaproteobacteria bacterium]
MANILTGCSSFSTTLSTDSATRYFALGDSSITYQSTEALSQIKCRTAGTASHLRAIVKSNARSTTTTITYRDNTADGNQTISIGSGVTGTIEDTTHSDTLSDGDLMALKIVTSTGGGAINIRFCDMRITPSSGSAKQIASHGSNSVATASQTGYVFPVGLLASSTTEVNVAVPAPVDLTLSNLQVYVSSNARTTNTVFTSRNNGADGNQTITFGSGVTGFLEDTTNSDSVTAGNRFGLKRVTGTGTGTLTMNICGYKVVTDGSGFPLFASGQMDDTSNYFNVPFGNQGNYGATESVVTWPAAIALTVSKLAVSVSANSSSTDTAYKVRDNGSDGTVVATITASTAGVFRDTTHSDSIAAGETLNYSITGMATGAPTIRSTALFATEANTVYTLSANSGSYTLTGTAATLKKASALSAAAGAYALTGTAANLLKAYPLAAGAGSYAVSGTAGDLKKTWKLIAGAGAYSVNGQTASLEKATIMSGGAGSYALSGQAAALKPAFKVSAAAGSYTINGAAASLEKATILAAGTGSYSISGKIADLIVPLRLQGDAGEYIIDGEEAALLRSLVMSGGAGAYNITGYSADLNYSAQDVAFEWLTRARRRSRR